MSGITCHGWGGHLVDEEFRMVTCGSVIKLRHASTGYRLHSHDIPYVLTLVGAMDLGRKERGSDDV